MLGGRTFVIGLVGIAAVAGAAAAIELGTRESAPSDAADSVAESPATTAARSDGAGTASAPAPDELRIGWKTDFAKHSVPFDEIRSGGPGKDGIPAIDAPQFVSVDDAGFLEDREPVIALEVDGDVRAYPIQILIWHEIVNDEVGGTPVTVTFCPLCNTSIVFDRRFDGRVLDFGVSGNLRNSDLVMYDRQTESWWQQFSGEAIVGEFTGKRLEKLPAQIVSWKDFRTNHPDAKVLSRATGFQRSYGSNPYVGYDDVSSPPFFATANADDDRLPPKERVVYLEGRDESVAIPFSALSKRREITVKLDGRELVARWTPGVASALGDSTIADGADTGSASVREGGKLVAFDEPFWFVVAAFRPDTRIIR